jgi:hypothetical protein
MMPLPASYADVHAAALVRKTELEQRALQLEAEGMDARPVLLAMLDLHFGLEEVAQATSAQAQADILGYLMETYGLLAVGTDPLLRPLLPSIPATGATLRYRVIALNDRPLMLNNKLLITVGATLSSSLSPAADA